MLRILCRPRAKFCRSLPTIDSELCHVPLISEITTKQDLLQLKQNFLRIKVPPSTFNKRIKTLRAEEELVDRVAGTLALRVQSNRHKSKTFVILDLPSSLTRDAPTVMEFYNKTLKDFDFKFKTLTDQNVHLVWSFNFFGLEVENSIDKPRELSRAQTSELVQETLKQRLLLHAKEYLRWGMLVRPENIFCTSQAPFIQTVYQTFQLLYSSQMIYKEFSPQLYSINMQRFMDKDEIRISFEKTEGHLIFCKISFIPEDSQLADILEDDLDLLNVNVGPEIGNILDCLTIIKSVVDKRTRHIVLFVKVGVGSPAHPYISPTQECADHFPVLDLVAVDTSNSVTLTGPKKNVYLVVTVRELFSLLFMRGVAVNPLLNYTLARHRDHTFICLTQCIDNQQFFKGRSIKRIRRFMGRALAGIVVDNPLQAEISCPLVLDQSVVPSDTSAAMALCPLVYQHDLHLSFDFPMDRRSVFDKFGRATFDLQSPDNGNTQVSPSLTTNFSQLIQNTKMKDWHSAVSTNSTIPTEFKSARNLVYPENLKFNSTFLQICSHFYFLYYYDFESARFPASNEGQLADETNAQKRLPNVDDHNPISKSFEDPKSQSFMFEGISGKSSEPTQAQAPSESEQVKPPLCLKNFTFLEPTVDPKSLPFSLALQQQLSDSPIPNSQDVPQSGFEYDFKTHATLLDSNSQLLQTSILDWVHGMERDNGQRQYGFGSDALRLLCASIDQTDFGTLEATLTAEMLNVKQAEINLLRKVFADLLKNAHGEHQILDVEKEELFLPVLERGVIWQLVIFSKLTTQAYQNKCYGEVYTLTMDFLKHYILDFYISIRTPTLILDSDSPEASQIKRLLNLILFSTLTTLAPILPFTTELMFLRSQAAPQPSIFQQKWPVLELQKLQIEESLVEKIEVLRLIKRSVLKVQRNEKLMESGASSYKFKIVIQASAENSPQSLLRANHFLEYLKQDFESSLSEIMECTQALVSTETHSGGEDLHHTEHVSLFVQGYKLRLDILFFPLERIGECARCLRYVRTDPHDAFCTDCASIVDPRFRDIYDHFFHVD